MKGNYKKGGYLIMLELLVVFVIGIILHLKQNSERTSFSVPIAVPLNYGLGVATSLPQLKECGQLGTKDKEVKKKPAPLVSIDDEEIPILQDMPFVLRGYMGRGGDRRYFIWDNRAEKMLVLQAHETKGRYQLKEKPLSLVIFDNERKIEYKIEINYETWEREGVHQISWTNDREDSRELSRKGIGGVPLQ